MTRRSIGVAAFLGALALCLMGPASASARGMVTARLAPATASDFVLSAVSCGSDNSCMATGGYTTSADADVTLAEHWSGHHWSVEHTPNLAHEPGSILTGVSCWSATSCSAVGSAGNENAEVTLAEHWNGHRWRIQHTPNPAGASSSFLTGVSCTSTTACTAIGGYINGASTRAFALAERWNGHHWTMRHAVTPAGSSASLQGVSCTSARACTAVGSYASGSFFQALAERWNGRKWRVQHTANPASPENFLMGVSCSSARACMATGSQGTTGFTIGLAMHWNGSKWTVQPSAAPAGGFDTRLPSVACWSAAACMAVGQYFIGADTPQALSVLRIPGTGWSIQHAPHGTAIDSVLNGVSCFSPRVCTAVGNYNGGRLLAWRWHGGNDGTWTIEQVPHP